MHKDPILLAEVINQASMILWSADKNGIFKFISPNIEDLCGFTPGEILNNQDYRWIHSDFRKIVSDAWIQTVAEKKPISIEYKMQIKNQNDGIWVKTFAVPKYDESGALLGWAGLIENISEQKRIVKNNEILIKDAQTKQKFEILGELTAVVAHELKNPLGTIRNSLFLLENRLDEEYVVDEGVDIILKRIVRSIDRCNNIVNDLLDYTRHVKLLKRRINVRQLVDKVLEDLVRPASVQINNEVSPNIHLLIDPDRMHRVFLNILKNSIEAIMDQEYGKSAGYINITSSITDQHTVISFYDNGPGIDPEAAEKLFEPLISTKSFGIGLGLSIVQDIMKKHNGHASMTGELDKFAQVDLKFNKKN